jgi:hypothetical protein
VGVFLHIFLFAYYFIVSFKYPRHILRAVTVSSCKHFSLLFAHELGHNGGADHDASQTGVYIMYPSTNGGGSGWSPQTLEDVGDYVETVSPTPLSCGNDWFGLVWLVWFGLMTTRWEFAFCSHNLFDIDLNILDKRHILC